MTVIVFDDEGSHWRRHFRANWLGRLYAWWFDRMDYEVVVRP